MKHFVFRYKRFTFSIHLEVLLLVFAVLSGCASTTASYTVDDGGPVDQQMLAGVRTYVNAQRLLRQAILRSTALSDPACSVQWELPFSVASSYGLSAASKRAWLRVASADERLTIIAVETAAVSGLHLGDKIESIEGYRSPNIRRMFTRLLDSRNSGSPFKIELSAGRTVIVQPFKVCRGYLDVALPEDPGAQNYHWIHSTHPLALFQDPLTSDEVLWTILWTQGLSEEAGARMKLYDYGIAVAKFGLDTAMTVSQVKAVSSAANAAASAAASSASSATSRAASQEIAQDAARKLGGREIAEKVVKNSIVSQANAVSKDIVIQTIKAATEYRRSFTGISYVASTGFFMADQWAFARMRQLGADPMAVFTLHYKMASKGDYQNAFVLDEDRLRNLSKIASENGLKAKMDEILGDTGIAAITSVQAPTEISVPSSRAIESFSLPTKPDSQ